jgi:general stress protein 26
MTDSNAASNRKLHELIKDMRFAMFTTRDEQGQLQSRPMTTQGKLDDLEDVLYFFASRGSEPVADLQRDPSVNVAYADPGKDSYVSVSGQATVVDDPALKRQLWSTFSQAWFPGGPEDPELALVRVSMTQADYWDVKESKPVQLFKMAKAALTGTRPSGMGERGSVQAD